MVREGGEGRRREEKGEDEEETRERKSVEGKEKHTFLSPVTKPLSAESTTMF